MRQFVAAVLVFVLAACGNGEAARQSVQNDLQIFSAQERVKAELRDPSSAEFTGITIPHEGISTVCGYVNSRNGFGGMAGPQRFITTKDSVSLEDRSVNAGVPFDGFWNQMCGG